VSIHARSRAGDRCKHVAIQALGVSIHARRPASAPSRCFNSRPLASGRPPRPCAHAGCPFQFTPARERATCADTQVLLCRFNSRPAASSASCGRFQFTPARERATAKGQAVAVQVFQFTPARERATGRRVRDVLCEFQFTPARERATPSDRTCRCRASFNSRPLASGRRERP